MNLDNINLFLDNYVLNLRKHYNIDMYPDFVDTKCNECDLETFKLPYYNNLKYEQIRLDLLAIEEPFHRASLLGFKINNTIIWQIIDVTYGQFFNDQNFESYMFENYKEFTVDMLKKGYVLYNYENMKAYLNGFILANPNLIKPNFKNVYDKMDEFLENNNIFIKKSA